MATYSFRVVARDSDTRARAGLLQTPHGAVETPIFMPVGTRGTVKGMTARDLAEAGAQIILANAYHLSLRPGAEQIAALGGLHRFMGWSGPILTDSGGFQLFSLAAPSRRQSLRGPRASTSGESLTDTPSTVQASPHQPKHALPPLARAPRPPGGSLVRITDEGAWFASPVDGSRQFISPEGSMDLQEAIGADIIMAFDECSRDDADEAAAAHSMDRTNAWLLRCRDRWQELEAAKSSRAPQALFGIVQGGNSRPLRERSASFVADLDLPGIAIGGESIGYSRTMTAAILDWVADLLPDDRPHYAMGIGEPVDFFAVVRRGVDMFDSVLPTRLARNGTLLTSRGRLRVLGARYADDLGSPDPSCRCYTCRTYSRAYLRYLFKAEELLAPCLATIHNVQFCLDLTRGMRRAIIDGRFTAFEQEFLAAYQAAGDI